MYKEYLFNLEKTLPSTPSILGIEENIPSAVLILLTLQQEELSFVLEKRAFNIKQGGEICFPGGRFDAIKDSSFLDTALRETEEELFIKKEKIKILGPFSKIITAMGSFIKPFVGFINPEDFDILQFDKKEVERIYLEPISFFKQNPPTKYSTQVVVEPFKIENGKKIYTFPAQELNLPQIYWDSWGHFSHEILVYPKNQCQVWGITAKLIKEMITILTK